MMQQKKIVTLKLDGNLYEGVKVFLEIGIDGNLPTIENFASLPLAKELIQSFQNWHHNYRRALNLDNRIKPKLNVPTNVKIEGLKTECQNSAITLHKSLNKWLKTDSFRPLCNICLKELSPSEEIKIIIRTDDFDLRKLPWQEWDLWQDYPDVEFVLSAPKAKTKKKSIRQQARILVILGNKEDINVEKDQQYLQKLCKTAEIVILDEPNRRELDQHLWDKDGWDLLFFSGHSQSETSRGRIFLNSHENDSLTMKELRYGLQTAVEKGLQLAIFNSCDGLGIAAELEQLHIPHIIVMTEPVPDKIAQVFLKFFLEEFTNGESLEKSVGIARRKLQSWEKDYPCASWLPVLVQNPLVKSPTWQKLNLGTISPYKGLAAFKEEDALYFFGRDEFIQQLNSCVNKQSLVAVIGASGSGKSSLIFAGLIPHLRKDSNCHWQIISCRPTNNPFQSLAIALLHHSDNLKPKDIHQQRLTELELETNLRSNPQALREFIEEKLIITPKLDNNAIYNTLPQKILLVIDQFEEIYTLCEAQERQLFLDSLLEAVNWTPMFTLIITLRADFYESALSYRAFSDVLQNRIQNIAPMNREELAQVITKPAQINQVSLEKGLTETLIDAVINESGNLPLLEFTLTQLWEKQTEEGLTYELYQKIGGVEKALANHGEIFYAQLTKQEREEVKNIFIQLVLVPLQGEFNVTRRIATKEEIKPENWKLVTKLANARLVITNRNESTGIETVEVIHEALISAWGRLHQWLIENKAFLKWKQQLRGVLQQWQNTNKDKGALLRGKSLVEAEDWLKLNSSSISQLEKQFIEASRFLKNKERRRVVTWLSGGLVAACSLSGWALWQLRQATINEINALNNSAETLLASNQELDAMVKGLKAAKTIKNSWFKFDKDTQIRVVGNLQNIFHNIKEFNRLESHTKSVNQVIFSRDGKTIVSASDDGTAKLWNIEGKLLATLESHTGFVSDVEFSPDEKTIATSSFDQTIKLWDRKGQLLTTLTGHNKLVNQIQFSPDGQTIASASDDKTVKLWSINGDLIATLTGHTNFVRHVRFSPDNKTIISAGLDDTVRIWDLQGKLLATINGHNSDRKTGYITTSPDAKAIASSTQDGKIKLWNLEGKLLTTLIGHVNGISQIEFSPDGKNIASIGWDNTLKLWNRKGKLLRTLTESNVSIVDVKFSPDGQTIASTGWDKTIKLWNLQGELISTFTGHTNNPTSIAFSPDGQTIASTSNDKTVKLWAIESHLFKTLSSHTANIWSVKISPDGQTIASASEDKTVKLWNTQGQLIKTLKGHNEWVNYLTFSPDGQTIASASLDKTVKFWNLQGELLYTFTGHSGLVRHIAFSPDGQVIASAGNDVTIKLWNTQGELLSNLNGHTDLVNKVKFSPNGQIIASASGDNTVKIWDTEGNLLQNLSSHTKWVNDLTFSPNGQIIASASGDNTVKLWNLKGELLHTLTSHTDSIRNVTFSPDGKTIVSTASDNSIKLWNLQGQLLYTMIGHNGNVNKAMFTEDGKTLISSSDDGTIKLWNTKGQLLVTLNGHTDNVTNIDLSLNNKTIVSASLDDTAKLWSLDLDDVLARGCEWMGDYLIYNPNISEDDQQICSL